MIKTEFSLTQVLYQPLHQRVFFEQVIREKPRHRSAPIARANGGIRLQTNPVKVPAHAAIAISTNARGTDMRKAVPLTEARRNVQTVYIPSGKTAAQ
jgi:hypothetical protein